MGRLIRWTLVLVALGAGGYYASAAARGYLAERSKVTYETAAVETGKVESLVRSTGEVQPVLSVTVGAFVSGPIIALHADFNDVVKEGDLLAEIDPRLPQASVARDRATLANARASVESVKAQLQQAVNDERRANNLRKESADYISQAEVDRFHFARLSLEAQLDVAKAGILQAEATLENSEANLGYTRILSPVDGIIIDRKIDAGQTVASGFQTPEMFTIAPRMREKMLIFASVDEADIGLIRAAQAEKRPVRFTVYAYPDDKFIGEIEQIRFSSAAEQNVVTYPVVVACPNPDLKLLPGMTADLSFLVEVRDDVVRVPNAALRYLPDAERVRSEDRWLITGKKDDAAEDRAAEGGSVADESVSGEAGSVVDPFAGGATAPIGEDDGVPPLTSEAADAGLDAETADDALERDAETKHVWVTEGQLLRAVEVRLGITDGKFTELLEGDVRPGDELVTGIKG